EAHCAPEPPAVAELLRFFAEFSGAAAHLGGVDVATTIVGRMEARVTRDGRGRIDDADDWRAASLRGLAVRRGAYQAAGGLDPRFGRFAESVLAMRLRRRGEHFGRAAAARLRHVNCHGFAELAPPLRGHGYGQAAYWAACEAHGETPAYAPMVDWSARTARHAPVARALCRAVVAVLRHPPAAAEWPTLRRALWHALPALLAGAGLGLRMVWLTAQLRWGRAWGRFQLARAGGDATGYRAFLSTWSAMVRRGVAGYIVAQSNALAAAAAAPSDGRWLVGDLPDGALAGFHAREVWGTERTRWSQAVALVRLRLAPGHYTLRLDLAAPEAPWASRALRVFFNRRAFDLTLQGAQRTWVAVQVAPADFAAGAEQHLILVCAPFVPRDHGQVDDRALGVALFSIAAAAADPRDRMEAADAGRAAGR
ncbi:MAG: glycosyltransferase family 2 protein, partial [Candidatus Binatia bacterium]